MGYQQLQSLVEGLDNIDVDWMHWRCFDGNTIYVSTDVMRSVCEREKETVVLHRLLLHSDSPDSIDV